MTTVRMASEAETCPWHPRRCASRNDAEINEKVLMARKIGKGMVNNGIKYLFFDIECSDGNHICSLGYVLTDSNFDINEKRDILVNPQCAFRLGRAGFDPYINLAYSKREFKRNPDFGKLYGQIAALLTAPNRVLLGHSVTSDIRFLETACDRYGKERLHLKVYDTQRIYAATLGEGEKRSLENIVKELEIDTDGLTAHKSSDDAEMTAYVARELCRKCDCSIGELLDRYPYCAVDDDSMRLEHRASVIRKVTKNALRKLPKDKPRDGIYISDSIAEHSLERRVNAVKKIFDGGYRFSLDLTDCKYVVSLGDITADERALIAQSADFTPEIISPAELSRMIGVEVSDGCECDE